MVEVWRVELQSESQTTEASPSAVHVLTFPPPHRHGRRYGFSSFIKSHPPQSLGGLVPCICDADDLRRRRLRVDVHGLSRESYVFVVVSSFFVPLLRRFRAAARFFCPPYPRRNQYTPMWAVIRGRRRRARYPGRCRAWPCRRACRRASCPCRARFPSSSFHP